MRLICKLLLGFEDEVLNATETLLYDKKVSCTKIDLSYSYYFIGDYMLVVISYYLR